MYSQLRMMVTQDHHGDEGQPYPWLGLNMIQPQESLTMASLSFAQVVMEVDLLIIILCMCIYI